MFVWCETALMSETRTGKGILINIVLIQLRQDTCSLTFVPNKLSMLHTAQDSSHIDCQF